MNALRHAESIVSMENERSDDENDAHSRQRGTRVLVSVESAPETQQLQIKVMHRAYGRMRLKVQNLRHDFSRASACLVSLAALAGIHSVRCNSWCCGAAIEYDPEIWTEKRLLDYLFDLRYGEQSMLALAPISAVPELTRRSVTKASGICRAFVSSGAASGAERLRFWLRRFPAALVVARAFAPLSAGSDCIACRAHPPGRAQARHRRLGRHGCFVDDSERQIHRSRIHDGADRRR